MAKTKSQRKGRISMIQAARALDLKTSLIDALEDNRYDWRTIDGLARTLDATKPEILAVLREMSDQLVSATADDGRILFTTRNHYEKTHGFRDKLLSALADKVVA
jgi:hypothetical protein